MLNPGIYPGCDGDASCDGWRMKKENVLITGASSGIGLALAHEFATQGHSLALTAPVEMELRIIAEELEETHGVAVQIIAQDLEEPDAAERLYEAIESSMLIDVL